MSSASGATSKPVVDVGIPAYKRPGYIVEAIESVGAQTFTNWRLTISDDGPGGGEVAAAVRPFLSDERIRYLPTGDRLGEAGNWTRLIQLATAPYVALLHDDDRWHPPFLERHVAFLDAHPECGFVFSGTNRIDAQGRRLRLRSAPIEAGVHPSREFSRRMLGGNIVGPPPSVVVRRSAYEAVGPVFRNDLPHADYEMWFRLALKFAVGYLDVHDADYRVHEPATRKLPPLVVEGVLRLADHVAALAEREYPDLVDDRTRGWSRAEILLLALAIESRRVGSRRPSIRLFAEAVMARTPALVDRRVRYLLRVLAGRPLPRVVGRAPASFGVRAPAG